MNTRLFFIMLVSVGVVVSFSGFPFLEKQITLDYIERVGVIEATEVHISSKISGRIQSIPFNEGDLVPLNAEVIRLHMEELEAEIAQAAANVLRGEADILTAQAILEKEKAVLKDSQRNLKRVMALHRDGLMSTAKLEKAETEFALSEAELAVARARIHSAKAELHQRQAHLHLYEVRLKEGRLHAPIQGRVTLKAHEAGEMVSPGMTVITLIDPLSIWARVDLEEGELGNIRIGSRAELRASGQSASFPARVVEIGTAGAFATQRDTTRGRQDIKTFRVKMALATPEGFLKPGMTVNTRIYFDSNSASDSDKGLKNGGAKPIGTAS
jgi:HlyD family secretion protein